MTDKTVIVTVSAERSNGWWVLTSDNGAVSQVRALSQADREMREAVAYLAGVAEDALAIQVVPVLPADYESYRDQVDQHRQAGERENHAAAQAARRAAAVLAATGMSVRDIGAVMGVSHQRAHQLVR